MTRHSDCQPFMEFPCWRLATIYLPLILLLKMVMVKYTGGPCGISKHNLKHFSRFFESVVKYGVSKQNLKHNWNISPDSVVNSVTTRTKTNPVSEQDVTEFRISWGSYADFESFQTQKSVSDPHQAINRNESAKSIHFAQFGCRFQESRLFQGRIHRFYYLSDCATGYKWTVTCVLV